MIYRSLNAAIQEIRLITLDPAPFVTVKVTDPASQQKSAPTDPVQCRLEHVSLDSSKLLQAFKETPPDKSSSQVDWDDCHKPAAYGDVPQWRYSWGDYVALSYAWGDPTRKRNIVLNGHQTAVGANLEAALRVLRCKQPIRAGYKIWIDALCINQQDLVERGQHLNRMQKIYKQAHDVVIWLGDEEDDSNKAMDLIRTLSSFFRAGQASVLGTALRQQPDLLGRGSWRALSVLLDRPYWDRLWVLQEIALGGYQSPILCGHQAVRWEELYSAIYYFGAHNFDVMFSLIDQERKDAGLPAAGLKRNKLIHLNEEQLVQTQQRKSQLMCMLDLGRKSLATDPRDKVYGLLGLMEASVSDQIIPDYTLPLSKVFTAFTKAMIVASMSYLFHKAQTPSHL
ncbi:MAG: hypothetical protein M1830_008291 [Pleopsidium flavum]|nr:MAG: hypothetical protein M1830_008291 [Pleopsidium flavum]